MERGFCLDESAGILVLELWKSLIMEKEDADAGDIGLFLAAERRRLVMVRLLSLWIASLASLCTLYGAVMNYA